MVELGGVAAGPEGDSRDLLPCTVRQRADPLGLAALRQGWLAGVSRGRFLERRLQRLP